MEIIVINFLWFIIDRDGHLGKISLHNIINDLRVPST